MRNQIYSLIFDNNQNNTLLFEVLPQPVIREPHKNKSTSPDRSGIIEEEQNEQQIRLIGQNVPERGGRKAKRT